MKNRLLFSSVHAQEEPVASLSATPSNSNIFRLTGIGFDASDTVWLRLVSDETVVFNFTETIETDAEGSFSAIVIVPTSIHGTFNPIALRNYWDV